MYDLKTVEAVFGNDLATFVKRKARGGLAGQKGTRYEERFALLKIGEAARRAFEGTGDFSADSDTDFYNQIPCFVDDLIVVFRKTNVSEHFQLKNQAMPSWGMGGKCIASDFANQLRLGVETGNPTTVTLVVNDEDVAAKLLAKRPRKLRKNVFVCYFPPATTLYELLEHEPMRNALAELLGPHPTDDHLVAIGRMMQGAWADAGTAVSLKQLLDEMHKSQAPLLRPLVSVPDLPQHLKTILDAIPNFHYRLDRGFLCWSYESADSGCLKMHAGTKEFETFSRRVVDRNPSTFESLEMELG